MISKPTSDGLPDDVESTDNPFYNPDVGVPWCEENIGDEFGTEGSLDDEVGGIVEWNDIRQPEQYGGDFQRGKNALIRFVAYWRDEREENTLDYQDVQDDWLMSLLFAEDPRSALACATLALRYERDSPEAHTELVNMPTEIDTTIEDLRAEDYFELKVMDVQVSSRSDSEGRLYRIRGECGVCGQELPVWQGRFDNRSETPPETCNVEACDGAVSVPETNKDYYSYQEFILQDLHKHTAKSQPVDITASLDCHLVEGFDSGDEVTVAAVVLPDESQPGLETPFYLQVVGIEADEKEFDTVEVSEDEEEQIRELAEEHDDIHEKLADCIAPNLTGGEQYSLARRAALYQLAGGVPMGVGQSRERGSIHLAFVGDPSTGKSQIGEAVSRIAPKSISVSGESTTKVGFTAAAVQEDKLGNKWVLKGGALVQADKGIAVIDELDKASEEHQNGLYGPLAKQKVEVSKSDIVGATLAARTSALVIANPTGERYDQHKPIVEQIGISPALFSRFDVIVPFIDRVDEEKDKGMMDKLDDMEPVDEDDFLTSGNGTEVDENDDLFISEDMLKKYISVARQITPRMTDNAKEFIKGEFSNLRAKSSNGKVAITARQGDAIRRMAQASARLRLSDTVTMEDVERARSLLVSSLEKVARDSHGDIDSDLLGPGPSAEQRREYNTVFEIIQTLTEAGDTNKASQNKVMKAATEEQDIDKHRAEAAAKRLHNEDKVWFNGSHYGVVGE